MFMSRARLRAHATACLRQAVLSLPTPLPPAARLLAPIVAGTAKFRRLSTCASRLQGLAVVAEAKSAPSETALSTADEATAFLRSLPTTCPGCGAFSQTVDGAAPGFYAPKSRAYNDLRTVAKARQDEIYRTAMARLGPPKDTKSADLAEQPSQSALDSPPSLCNRCNRLSHRVSSDGDKVHHPTMESIQSIIESSPFRNNHIYHVIDAADFPMSLIPNLVAALELPRLRTQNRRSKSMRYIKDRTAEVSFIITRSDLLAPQKEQVDRMLPYLQQVLRDALGRTGRNIRLGNLRCVSAKRGWWTPSVKQDIWKRGGAGWVVGKANVGKSALFEVVFPKGRNLDATEAQKMNAIKHRHDAVTQGDAVDELDSAEQPFDPNNPFGPSHSVAAQSRIDAEPSIESKEAELDDEDVILDENDDASLLPPVQPATQYPRMPIVSSLPGTTISPIRIPFGNGKGELIDLPGVDRSSLEAFVQPQHQSSLIMQNRIVPEQIVIKPGQSLLIGGVIRIVPKTEDVIFLAYPFVNLQAHCTSHEKARAIQTGMNSDGTPYEGHITSIATPSAATQMQSAGSVKLEWDVTKQRTGALTSKVAGKVRVDRLPFSIYSADILIAGMGWVEIACQVRNRSLSRSDPFGNDGMLLDKVPEVEVFSPKGQFIDVRRPMNAYIIGGPKKDGKHSRQNRPRMSISTQKRKQGGRDGH